MAGGQMLDLTGSSSKVTLAGFAGNVRLIVNYSTLRASGITGSADITDQSGTIDLDTVGGNAKLAVNYSTVNIGNVRLVPISDPC